MLMLFTVLKLTIQGDFFVKSSELNAWVPFIRGSAEVEKEINIFLM